MDNDKLLKTLGEHARRQAVEHVLGDRWDAYCAGRLSEEELRQLHDQLPIVLDGEKIEEAFKPLSEEFREAMFTQSKRQAGTPVDEGEIEQNVTTLKPRRIFLVPAALAATLLAALGVSLLLLSSKDFAPLPRYEAVLVGGTEFRSQELTESERNFNQGEQLQLTFTPASRIDETIEGSAWLINGLAVQHLDQVDFEFAESGAVRLAGRIGQELPGAPGKYRLLVSIGLPKAALSAKDLVSRFEEEGQLSGQGWQAWHFEYTVN